MATHSSILAWRVPWTEEPGGLMGSQRASDQHTRYCFPHFIKLVTEDSGGFRPLPRPPAGPPGCGRTQRGLAERGPGHTALGEGCALRATASSTASSGSQQRSRTRLECLVGGTCDSCWKNRRPPRGTENHPEASKCGKASRPAGRRTGVRGADLRGPGDAGWIPRGGRGRGKEPACPPNPPQAFRSLPARSSGPGGGGPALRCAGGGGLGSNLAICLG